MNIVCSLWENKNSKEIRMKIERKKKKRNTCHADEMTCFAGFSSTSHQRLGICINVLFYLSKSPIKLKGIAASDALQAPKAIKSCRVFFVFVGYRVVVKFQRSESQRMSVISIWQIASFSLLIWICVWADADADTMSAMNFEWKFFSFFLFDMQSPGMHTHGAHSFVDRRLFVAWATGQHKMSNNESTRCSFAKP